MSQPILDPHYWSNRLDLATLRGELHHAIFKCPRELWDRIEEVHRLILSAKIEPEHSILDVGCGYGRLLKLLPTDWQGDYLGLDLSLDFVGLARSLHPGREFRVCDLTRYTIDDPRTFDWAICISMRPMIRRELGDEVWQAIEYKIKGVAKRILFLEYDVSDPGEVIEW